MMVLKFDCNCCISAPGVGNSELELKTNKNATCDRLLTCWLMPDNDSNQVISMGTRRSSADIINHIPVSPLFVSDITALSS